VRVRPTFLGAKGACFLAAIEVAFLATPYSNLFFLLLCFLGVLTLLAGLWSFCNLRAVAAQLLGTAPAPAGNEHDVRLELCVRGRRPRFQIDCWLEFGHGRYRVAALPLLRGSGKVAGRLPGQSRGVHAVRQLVLRSRYPFGILEWSRRIALTAEVVAYPPPLPVLDGDPNSTLAAVIGDRQVAGGDDMVAGIRPFQPGDSLRMVHWKASARRTQLVVRELDRDSGAAFELCIDRRCSAEDLDLALQIACALLLRAGEAKTHLTLTSQGHAAVYGPGQQPTAAALRWLAAAAPLPAEASPPPICPRAAIRLPVRRRAAEVAHG